MAFTIPDKGEGQSDLQSILFQEYIDVLVAGIGGDAVLNGGIVTAQGSPNMTVQVANAAILSGGTLRSVVGAAANIATANASLPRIDMVVADSAGNIAVRAGTPAAVPLPGARSAGDVAFAAVFVPATDTAIGSDQITDMRIVRAVGPTTLKQTTSAVTFNTTNAIQTYFNVVLPAGLMSAGRQVRVRCGGTYLSNSGTGTWTLTIAYGGTTLFADATGATTADADRGAWNVDFILNCSANAVQSLGGVVNFQTPGAKTAPATGIGDMGVTTSPAAPIKGNATVDSMAADRALTVRWTMSVSNAAAETTMEYGFAELL